MRLTGVWKSIVLVFIVSALWILVLAGMDGLAQAAQGQAKVERLVIGLINPIRDYWRSWITNSPDHNIQHDPILEWLIEIDADTGKYVPWLAKSWKMGSVLR